jgi:colicin import membrane protein
MSALAFVEELERRDADVADRLASVEELERTVDRLRVRAVELLAFRASLPGERAVRARAVGLAQDAVAVAQATLAQAEAELERVREKERAAAEHAVAVAREAERSAARELERMRNAAAALEEEAAQAEVEARELEGEAGRTAERLAAVPRLSHDAARLPRPGLEGVEEWGARARPALLLLRAALAAERDAIVREANELGSAVLGESLGAASVRRVRERLEREPT